VAIRPSSQTIDPGLARLAATNAVALEDLLNDHKLWFTARIRAAAWRSCPNEVGREDFFETVQSEVFASLQQVLSRWSKGSLEAFLSKSIRNVAVDVSRGIRAKKRSGKKVSLDAADLRSSVDPDQEARKRERAEILWNAVQSMAAESDAALKWAVVLRSVCLEGVSPEELAVRMSVPRNTIDKWKGRGMIRIAEILAARGHTARNLL
jgi:DNA-directed RNA polymerase specialized sigma24 family protein